MRDYRLFVASVVNQRTCRYDSSNTEHEDLLEQVRTLTMKSHFKHILLTLLYLSRYANSCGHS
jgi:hypothetical protein